MKVSGTLGAAVQHRMLVLKGFKFLGLYSLYLAF
jgi:hypothetical protein